MKKDSFENKNDPTLEPPKRKRGRPRKQTESVVPKIETPKAEKPKKPRKTRKASISSMPFDPVELSLIDGFDLKDVTEELNGDPEEDKFFLTFLIHVL